MKEFDLPSVQDEKPSERKRTLMLAPKKKTDSKRYIQEKAQYRAKAQARAKRMVQLVIAIFAISVMLLLLLMNQSKVVELNFANAQLQKSISKAQIMNVQKQSEIIQLTDLEAIRAKAILLGFQEPGPDQIIYLAVPKKDKLLLQGQVDSENSAELSPVEEAAYNNIEAYFRSLQD